jgi:hypothetical protein
MDGLGKLRDGNTMKVGLEPKVIKAAVRIR